MPVGRAAVAAAEQREPVVEAPVDVGDRHRPGPWPRPARSRAAARRAARRRGGRRRPAAGRRAGRPRARWRNSVGARVLGQLGEREDPLGRDRQRRPGGGDARAASRHVATRNATRSATASTTCSQLSRISSVGDWSSCCAIRARTSARCSGVSDPAAAHRVADAERRADLADHVVGRRDADQLDEVHDRLLGLAAEQVREPGLAEPTGPRIETTRASRTSGPQRPDVLVAADQRGRVVADALAHRAGRRPAARRARPAARGRGRHRAGRPGRPAAARSASRAAGAPRTAASLRSRAANVASSRGRRPRAAAAASSWSPSTDRARPRTAARDRAVALGSARGRRRGGRTPRRPRGRAPARARARSRASTWSPRPSASRAASTTARARASASTGPGGQSEAVAAVGADHDLGRRSASAPGRPRPGAPWPGWPGRRRSQTSSTSASSETPLRSAATRAASSAWVRPPGSGSPRQETSSSSLSRRSSGEPLHRAQRWTAPHRSAARATAASRAAPVSASVRVRSGARKRSAKASDLRPSPTWAPV